MPNDMKAQAIHAGGAEGELLDIRIDPLQFEAVNELIRTAGWLHGYLRCSLQLSADFDAVNRSDVLTAFNRLHDACCKLNGEYEGLGL